MFSSRANYLKLRTNLRLCINRLKLLEKKKTELALKARREIADYIAAGKEDRARIRVEHIIREDYLVEALEIIEMLCDLLLARFGLIEKMNELDPGLEEAISTILWVAPRLCSEIQELREVANQLTIKYGKEYADMCRRNGFETVNEKVLHKLSLAAPPKILVENYMIEIARTYKVPFEPDPMIMMGQPPETDDLIELGTDMLSTVDSGKGAGSGGHFGGGSGGPGFSSGGGPGFGGGGGMGFGGGGRDVNLLAPDGGFSKHPPPSGTVPSNPPGTGRPSSTIEGFPVVGADRNAVSRSASWNCAAATARPGENDASMGTNQPHSGAVGTGMQYGVGVGMHGNGNNSGMPVGFGGPPADGGMSMSGVGEMNVNGIGMDANISAAYTNVPGHNVNVGSTAGANLPHPAGYLLPDCHNPLAGGVPVLPNDDGNFPDPIQSSPYSTIAASPNNPASTSPSRLPPPLPNHRPNVTSPGYPSPAGQAGTLPAHFDESALPQYDDVVRSPDQYRTLPGGSRSPAPGTTATLGPTVSDLPSLPDIPVLPNIPTNSVGGASVGGDDVDFDDLTRRFEELKRRN